MLMFVCVGAGHAVRAGWLPVCYPGGPGPLAAPLHQPPLTVRPAAPVPGRQLAGTQVRSA